MKLAILSDVHGNRFALEAVLADLERERPDEIVNLGDQLWGGADPLGAWRLQQNLGRLAGQPTVTEVRGNTDEFLTAPLEQLEGSRPYAGWLHGQLGDELPRVASHLAALEPHRVIAGGEVLVAHGTVGDPWRALFENTSTFDASPLLRAVSGFAGLRVVVVGHTHLELLRSDSGITFVNSGPVSRQKDGDPAARWTLLERHTSGWNVQFRRVPYDVEAAAQWAITHALEGQNEARRLRAGRE